MCLTADSDIEGRKQQKRSAKPQNLWPALIWHEYMLKLSQHMYMYRQQEPISLQFHGKYILISNLY